MMVLGESKNDTIRCAEEVRLIQSRKPQEAYVGQQNTVIIQFPVPSVRREAKITTAILDLSGMGKGTPVVGAVRGTKPKRPVAAAVTLPQLSIYNGEAVYYDRCIIIDGKVVRGRTDG
jgi:hypothetical protein